MNKINIGLLALSIFAVFVWQLFILEYLEPIGSGGFALGLLTIFTIIGLGALNLIFLICSIIKIRLITKKNKYFTCSAFAIIINLYGLYLASFY
ncbi:MAG: hypothetical protein COA79_22425 [Planctomycetota bacterium]|nr:MAG: hypothetical protein COA79_22425 [Planctomycetota bacterium]